MLYATCVLLSILIGTITSANPTQLPVFSFFLNAAVNVAVVTFAVCVNNGRMHWLSLVPAAAGIMTYHVTLHLWKRTDSGSELSL